MSRAAATKDGNVPPSRIGSLGTSLHCGSTQDQTSREVYPEWRSLRRSSGTRTRCSSGGTIGNRTYAAAATRTAVSHVTNTTGDMSRLPSKRPAAALLWFRRNQPTDVSRWCQLGRVPPIGSLRITCQPRVGRFRPPALARRSGFAGTSRHDRRFCVVPREPHNARKPHRVQGPLLRPPTSAGLLHGDVRRLVPPEPPQGQPLHRWVDLSR